MSKLNILVICRHEEILATIIRLINTNEQWNATGVVTDEEAIATFGGAPFAVVLLGNGIEATDELKLTQTFKSIRPEVSVIPHYGGGSGLLFAEIYEALAGRL